MISDILLFLRIGFLFKNELDLDKRLLSAGDVEGRCKDFSEPVCKGPYNQVTSQSLSLEIVRQSHCLESAIQQGISYQLRVSGDTVFQFVL